MNEKALSGTARVMMASLLALFALFLAGGLAATRFIYPFSPPLAFALGMVLSTSVSAGKIWLLDRMLRKAVDMPADAAKNYGTSRVVFRQLGTVVAVLPAVFFPAVFNVFGVIVGLLLLQLSAYVSSAVIKKRPDLAGLEK